MQNKRRPEAAFPGDPDAKKVNKRKENQVALSWWILLPPINH